MDSNSQALNDVFLSFLSTIINKIWIKPERCRHLWRHLCNYGCHVNWLNTTWLTLILVLVLDSLGPFGAILSDLLSVSFHQPQTTQNRQVHAKQDVLQLYFIIHNNIIHFWEIEWIPMQSLINHSIREFPYIYKSRNATVNTNCKLGLPVVQIIQYN